MPNLDDFTRFASYLPAAVAFFSNAIAIHSLWLPNMSNPRRLSLIIYMFVTVALTGGVWYQSASTAMESRVHAEDAEQKRENLLKIEEKIDTIKSYLGSVPATPSIDILDRIIARIAKPDQITPAQMAKLAHSIALFKDMIPKNVYIARNAIYFQNGADYSLYFPLMEAFSRNGIQAQIISYTPKSIQDQGTIIAAIDPMNPPAYAKQMLAAFGQIQMPQVKIGYVDGVPYGNSLTIVIGPAPIN